LKIVIDENIPFGREAFGKLGSVVALPGRAISPEGIQDATVLVVRSITPVNAALLQGSAVQFVGTATAGCDHIDQGYLKKNHILFASAAGANANAVAEYVLCALLMHARKHGTPLKGKSLGIIGVGHIGQLLAQKAMSIGMVVILNDPPLQRRSGKRCYRPFQEACDADFVSLHVPLNDHGPDTTRHLLNQETLSALNPQTVLVNTSRGEVIDQAALLKQIKAERLAPPILDVWADEPAIDWDLVQAVEIGTPHIAGYSLDGKIAGTKIIYETVCAALGVMPTWTTPSLMLPQPPPVQIDTDAADALTTLSDLTGRAYHLSGDVARFMGLLDLPCDARPAAFDRLRKTYPPRREFQCMPLSLRGENPERLQQIQGLGFKPVIKKRS